MSNYKFETEYSPECKEPLLISDLNTDPGKLPFLYSPKEKLEKSRQFYNYLQTEMAKEYGIDIDNGVILKDKKKHQTEILP